MSYKLLLDTNSFFLLFSRPTTKAHDNLFNEMQRANAVYAPQITFMEIYSVIGKYRRFNPSPPTSCCRHVKQQDGTYSQCCHTWRPPHQRRLNKKQYMDMMKLVHQVELGHGPHKITTIEITPSIINEGRELLKSYSALYNFGSHDALIAGFHVAVKKEKSLDLTICSSDKGLKALLKAAKIPHYDPRTGTQA